MDDGRDLAATARWVEILAGVGGLEPLPPKVVQALERVEIEAALGERGRFRLTFRTERRSDLPEHFLDPGGGLLRMVLRIGEGEAAEVAMDGVLTVHTLAPCDGGAELILEGEDLTLLMDLLDASGRPFPGMAAPARVATILAAYSARGITATVVPPPLADPENPNERIFHQQGSDYAYLRTLARDCGYRFTLDPGPLAGGSLAYWGPEPRGNRSAPVLVVPFGKPGPGAALHLRFDALRAIAPLGTVLDPASKTAIPIPVPGLAALGGPLGATLPPALRLRRLAGTAKLTPTRAAAALLAEAGRSAEGTTASGALEVGGGRRRLRPGQVVEVQGAANPFDGLYAVQRVQDTLTAGSHRQRFELVRAGLGAAGSGSA